MVRFSRASIVFFLISAGLHAWDGTGHQMVASVAFRHMNQQSRDRLLILLRRHPKFACWTAGVPAGDNAQLLESAIREAAIWADSIKSLASGSTDPLPHCYTAADRVGERAYRSDGDSYGTDLQSKTSAALNIGYTDHLMHKYWHFDDLPIAPTPAIAATRPPQDINAAERILRFRDTLARPETTAAVLDLKSFDAVWLIHIAGDIHQPLHSVTRYQSASDKGDAGGNGVTLSGHAGKLHTYWDHLPDHILTQNLQPSPTALVSIDDPGAWAKESFRFAVNDGYVSPIGEGIGPFTLNAAYESNALKRAHFQIELAGERLARLFESSLH